MANTDPVDAQLRVIASRLTVLGHIALRAIRSDSDSIRAVMLNLQSSATEAFDLAQQIQQDDDMEDDIDIQYASPLFIGAGLALLASGIAGLVIEGVPPDLKNQDPKPKKSKTVRRRK